MRDTDTQPKGRVTRDTFKWLRVTNEKKYPLSKYVIKTSKCESKCNFPSMKDV
jgi:hypothetical protein